MTYAIHKTDDLLYTYVYQMTRNAPSGFFCTFVMFKLF